MKRKRLALNATTIRFLSEPDLDRAAGGDRTRPSDIDYGCPRRIHETEPYSACGMCVPITYMTCQC